MPEPPSSSRPGPHPPRAFFVSLLISAFGLAILLVGDRGTAQWQRAKEESRALKAQVASLESENADLEARIADTQKSDFETEKNARENLGLVKPGDVVFVLPDLKAAR